MKALLLVDHGSMKNEANDLLAEIAELVRSLRPNLHVEIAHMELADPSIADGIAACVNAGATDIIVHPYMLAPGRHATKDIPRLACEAVSAYPDVKISVTPPLGVHNKLAEVLLERAEL